MGTGAGSEADSGDRDRGYAHMPDANQAHSEAPIHEDMTSRATNHFL